MNLALLGAMTAPNPPRRKGRPAVSEDQAARLKHIQCATMLLGSKFSGKRVAALFGVSRRTAYNWRDLALTYDEPEAVALRRLVRRPEVTPSRVAV